MNFEGEVDTCVQLQVQGIEPPFFPWIFVPLLVVAGTPFSFPQPHPPTAYISHHRPNRTPPKRHRQSSNPPFTLIQEMDGSLSLTPDIHMVHRKRSSSLPVACLLSQSTFLGDDSDESRTPSPTVFPALPTLPEVVEWGARGLTSGTFDTSRPFEDVRSGFMKSDVDDIERIMESRGISFDEARYLHVQAKMVENGIDPETGTVNDARAVTFERLRKT